MYKTPLWTVLLPVALFCLLAVGCASPGPEETASLQDLISKKSLQESQADQLNEQLFASLSGTVQPGDYALSQGDLLEVKVFGVEELNTTARVGARGYATLSLLGPVRVAGLTARQAEQKIEDLYQKDYLQDPHVTVFVKEHFGSKISVLGAIKNPGTYDYLGRQRLLDVLALAGGLSDKAGAQVQVRRKSDQGEKPNKYLVDLNKLINQGETRLNLMIRGGDVLFVPEAGTVYVDGAVRKPGNYNITKEMTVLEAIVAAGGFNNVAEEDAVKLVRVAENGSQEVVRIRKKDLKNQDIRIQDRDVIFVETNTMEALMYGLRLNIGGGLLGVGYSPPSM